MPSRSSSVMRSRADPDHATDETVQPLVRLVLVQLQMRGRVERDDAAASPIRMDPERDLLRHRAAGHEHRRRLPEQLADLRLEDRHHAAVPVPVLIEILGRQRRDLREHVGRRPQAVTAQRPGATGSEPPNLGVGEIVRRLLRRLLRRSLLRARLRHVASVPVPRTRGPSGCLSSDACEHETSVRR